MAYDTGSYDQYDKKYPGVFSRFVGEPQAVTTLGGEGVVAITAFVLFSRNPNKFEKCIDVVTGNKHLIFRDYTFADHDIISKMVDEILINAHAVRIYPLRSSQFPINHVTTKYLGGGMDVDGRIKIFDMKFDNDEPDKPLVQFQNDSLLNGMRLYITINSVGEISIKATSSFGVDIEIASTHGGPINTPSPDTIYKIVVIFAKNNANVNFSERIIIFNLRYLRLATEPVEIVIGGNVSPRYDTQVQDDMYISYPGNNGMAIVDVTSTTQLRYYINGTTGFASSNGFIVLSHYKESNVITLSYCDTSLDIAHNYIISRATVDKNEPLTTAIIKLNRNLVRYGITIHTLTHKIGPQPPPKLEKYDQLPYVVDIEEVAPIDNYVAGDISLVFNTCREIPKLDEIVSKIVKCTEESPASLVYVHDWKYYNKARTEAELIANIDAFEKMAQTLFATRKMQMLIDYDLARVDDRTFINKFPLRSPGIIALRSKQSWDSEIIGAWFAGAFAGCPINASCTAKQYNGSVIIPNVPSGAELKTLYDTGFVSLHYDASRLMIYIDCNAYDGETAYEGIIYPPAFTRNYAVRIVASITYAIRTVFIDRYMGKALTGHNLNLLKSDILDILSKISNTDAIYPVRPNVLVVQPVDDADNKIRAYIPLTLRMTAEQIYIDMVV